MITIYEWPGDRVGIQWDGRGPIVVVNRDGATMVKFNAPADATVLVSADDSFGVTGNDASYDDGYEDGYDEAVRHMESALDGLRA